MWLIEGLRRGSLRGVGGSDIVFAAGRLQEVEWANGRHVRLVQQAGGRVVKVNRPFAGLAVGHIAGLALGDQVHAPPHRDADLERFLASLATAWKDGEVRSTHQPQSKVKAKRWWRTRQDPFEEVWPRILVWLESEPDQTAKELFARLRAENPGKFPPNQLRTLQRRVKDWRMAAARRLVFSDATRFEGGVSGEATGL